MKKLNLKIKAIASLLAIAALCTSVSTAKEPTKRISEPVDRKIKSEVFMPKGTIFAGGVIGYSNYSSDDFKFLLLDNLGGKVDVFGGRVFTGYTFANNVAAGLGFEYSQNVVQIDNADISLGDDLNFNIEDSYSIQQIYTAEAFLRTYVNLGSQKRFALFNDVRVYLGGGTGKMTSGASGSELYTGTYQKITKMGLSIVPGIMFFATDFFSIEGGVGILGIEYSRTEQITNQVYQGYYESFDANFKLNLLSLRLGMSFYF